MTALETSNTVGEFVARHPGLSRVFEEAGIDYCCGGRRPLEEACREKGIDPVAMLATLEESSKAAAQASDVDAAGMSLTELVDHIEQTHHQYLREEFPRLDRMTARVATVHGDKEPRLLQIREAFVAMAAELTSHMMKEEQILFPMCRQLEAGDSTAASHCGSIANPIQQMESEHAQAGSALETLRELTDGYSPPDWACNTYRAMFDGLAQLERDLHVHIHKENNVLFLRAIEMERTQST